MQVSTIIDDKLILKNYNTSNPKYFIEIIAFLAQTEETSPSYAVSSAVIATHVIILTRFIYNDASWNNEHFYEAHVKLPMVYFYLLIFLDKTKE